MKLTTPLIPIVVPSIYNNHGPLPARMAKCTPDTAAGLEAVRAELTGLGFQLRLSDLFRSSEMQRQAHDDFVSGRKKAFSPPAGSSMHEAGRAMDIDLSSMGVPLPRFWEIARAHGFFPIIDAPIPSRSESWHFDRRGSHDVVYQYVRDGHAGASLSPYAQMAMSGILALGVALDTVPDQDVAFQQAALIRLGFDPGRIDGVLGDRTRGALRDAGVDTADPIDGLSQQLRAKFPDEL